MRMLLMGVSGFFVVGVATGCGDNILTVEDLGVPGEGSVVTILEAYLSGDGDIHYFQYRERQSDDDFPYFVVKTDNMYKEYRKGGISRARPEEFVAGRKVRIWPYPERAYGVPVPLAVLIREG